MGPYPLTTLISFNHSYRNILHGIYSLGTLSYCLHKAIKCLRHIGLSAESMYTSTPTQTAAGEVGSPLRSGLGRVSKGVAIRPSFNAASVSFIYLFYWCFVCRVLFIIFLNISLLTGGLSFKVYVLNAYLNY